MKAAKELEAEKQEQRDMAQDMQLMKEKEMQDVCGVSLIIPKHTHTHVLSRRILIYIPFHRY